MTKDWRLNGQERCLFQAELYRCKFRFPEPEEVDHAHCKFCWAKFSENEDDLHEGYITKDREHVICEECFQDFKERFQWRLINSGC